MGYCVRCNHERPRGARTCPGCGAPFQSTLVPAGHGRYVTATTSAYSTADIAHEGRDASRVVLGAVLGFVFGFFALLGIWLINHGERRGDWYAGAWLGIALWVAVMVSVAIAA